jgi:hypothetical protein
MGPNNLKHFFGWSSITIKCRAFQEVFNIIQSIPRGLSYSPRESNSLINETKILITNQSIDHATCTVTKMRQLALNFIVFKPHCSIPKNFVYSHASEIKTRFLLLQRDINSVSQTVYTLYHNIGFHSTYMSSTSHRSETNSCPRLNNKELIDSDSNLITWPPKVMANPSTSTLAHVSTGNFTTPFDSMHH